MSAPTSTNSPRGGSISDDGFFAFDGAEALLGLGRRAEARSAAHRLGMGGPLPDAELARRRARRYRTRRTPYMKEIMDALSPGRPAQRIVFMKAAGSGRRSPPTRRS